MEQKEVIEKKEAYVECTYLYAKSERYPKIECSVKVVMPLNQAIKSTDDTLETAINNVVAAEKKSVQKNI